MVLPTVYFFNLVCAVIPCTASQPLPEAYISEFTEPTVRNNNLNNLISNNNISPEEKNIISSSSSTLDPVLNYNAKLYINSDLEQEEEDNLRSKRYHHNHEWHSRTLPSSRRRTSAIREFRDQNRRSRMIDTSSQINSMIPNLLSSISIPAIPALINTIMRNVNSISGNEGRLGRQLVREYDPPRVSTKYGDIEGYFMGTMKGRKISAFEGIPYAEPPLGKYRFAPPVPKSPWKDVLQAKKTSSKCLQGHPLDFFRVTGSEDCIYLNVYTPQLPGGRAENASLPVIFMIHGGSFQYGSGAEYGASYILDKEVILVTFNYRLGPLGFLSTGDFHSPGNNGLRDQALALKFVYENIASFGGDNTRITIMGQSAGGVSAHLHLIANKTTQYFHNGVSLSGSSFGFWPIVGKKRITELTNKLATVLNCPTYDNAELMKCLRRTNAAFLTAAQLQLYDWIPFHPLVLFAPTVEAEGPDAFLTKTPEQAYQRNEVMNKPWIFGQTSQEGHFDIYFIKLMMQSASIVLNGRKYLPMILDYAYFTKPPRTSEITNEVLDFYGGSLVGNGIDIAAISDMITDRLYTSTIRKAIKAHSAIAPTYAYVFDYKGKYNLGSLFGAPESDWGVSHTEDMFYYFNSSVYHHGLQQNDPEYGLSQILTDVLANFVAKGEPTHINEDNKEISFWQPVNPKYSNQPLQYLKINREITMIPDPFEARVAFWDSLYIN